VGTIRQPNSSSRGCLAGRTRGTGSPGPLPASATCCQDDLGVRHYGAVSKRRPPPGSVIQVPLPDGRFAYGRVYRDAAVCFYRYATTLPGEPPIGLRNFAFCVGVYDDVVASWEVVGVDGFSPEEDNGWPPASGVRDPISGAWRVYHRGAMRAATEDEARDLEPAAVWDEGHLLPRLAEGLSES